MTFGLTNTALHPDNRVTQEAIGFTPPPDQDIIMKYPYKEVNYRKNLAKIPVGSKFQPGAHWHEDYDEIMKVIKGRMAIRLGSNPWKVVTAEDGEVFIPRMVVHDLRRADVDAKPGEGDDEELWVEEQSEPVDGSKELFFRHLLSATSEPKVFGWKFPLWLLLHFSYTDNYIEIVPGHSYYVTHGLYAFIRPIAGWFGLKPFYDEYTPERLQEVRKKLENKGKAKKE